MNKLSLNPDADMAWIYNCYHPSYDSERAKDLRERRAAALANCPPWLWHIATTNDAEADANRNPPSR